MDQKKMDELLSAWGALQEKLEKKDAQTDAVTRDEITRLNAEIQELKTAGRRPAVASEQDEAEMERKSAVFGYLRGDVSPEQQKALVSDANGGIIIPESLDASLLEKLAPLTVIRSRALHATITTNKIRRRDLGDVSMAFGQPLETGGAAPADSAPVASEDFIHIRDLYGMAKLGRNLLADTDIRVEEYVNSRFAVKRAQVEDDAFVVGAGANGPEGILTGTTAGRRKETAGIGTMAMEDLIRLPYHVKAGYRRNGAWLVSSGIEMEMRLLKDADGRPLWQPSLQAGKPATFGGFEVLNQDAMAGTVAAGNEIAIFGSIGDGYAVIDHAGGMSLQRLNELYALSGQVGVLATFRVGGGVVRDEAFAVLKVRAV